MKYSSNCCGAPVWQPDQNGHGHCQECRDTCVPQKQYMKTRKNITIDPATHKAGKELAQSKGLSFSAFVELLLREVIRESKTISKPS